MIERNIALFISTHETISAEKFLIKGDINFRTIIKPRSITSECSMALEFDSHDREKVRRICKDNNLKLSGIFSFDENGIWKKLD